MVPDSGMPRRRAAQTLEVPSSPARKAERAAQHAARGPWARREPKSTTRASPAASRTRAALEATRVEKETAARR
ncbi:hypothetical protein HRbin09_01777 [bacterium HR09]|nr:hypothetical protein HRbin09_01777 [bacterium HR09]